MLGLGGAGDRSAAVGPIPSALDWSLSGLGSWGHEYQSGRSVWKVRAATVGMWGDVVLVSPNTGTCLEEG